MSKIWEELLIKISKSDELAPAILETIPKKFRPRALRSAFANPKEQAEWINELINKLGGHTIENWRHVRSIFAILDKLPEDSVEEIGKFIKNMKNLSASEVKRLMELKDNFEKAIKWDHTAIEIIENGKTTIIKETDKFGKALESRAIEEFPKKIPGAVVADLNKIKPNFPGVDIIVRIGKDIQIGQITHGNLQSLLKKFRKLLDIEPSSDAVNKAREEMMGILIEKGACTSSKDFLSKAKLFIPSDLVEPLKAVVRNHPDVASWCTRTGLLEKEKEKLLDVIAALPGIPP